MFCFPMLEKSVLIFSSRLFCVTFSPVKDGDSFQALSQSKVNRINESGRNPKAFGKGLAVEDVLRAAQETDSWRPS